MLDELTVVLVRPKYPENIGSAARACLNMGVTRLCLVAPVQFDMDKALPLATVHAKSVLEHARMVDTLPEALAGMTRVYATTARTGGWRKGVMHADTAAGLIRDDLARGGRVAVVFGPEDTGLTNEETRLCSRLVTIPTSRAGTSLNLAQAVLLVLYECLKAALGHTPPPGMDPPPPDARACTFEEQQALEGSLKETLAAIDYLRDGNEDYWMLPVRRFLSRLDLRRHEFNLLMGICRQVRWVAGQARPEADGRKQPD